MIIRESKKLQIIQNTVASSNSRKTQQSYHKKKRRLWYVKAMGLLFVLFLISGWKLISYWNDYVNIRQSSYCLRSAYNESMPEMIAEEQTKKVIFENSDALITQQEKPVNDREKGWYASVSDLGVQSSKQISKRFQKIRRMNKDIIGWLHINNLVDEAVVQRDNKYYLKRDYRGYHNTNGALFLDEICNIDDASPITFIIHGHNMKTGAMFGSLRDYQKLRTYLDNPFIQFDTMYADGAYVIFAVSTANILEGAYGYSDFYRLSNCGPTERERILGKLNKVSLYFSPINVQAEDDLLILTTCTGDANERFVIAARKIRVGENKEDLQEKLQNTICK